MVQDSFMWSGYTNWTIVGEFRPHSRFVIVYPGVYTSYLNNAPTPEIKLCLSDSRSDNLLQSQSHIIFHITRQEHVPAGAEAIADARRALYARNFSVATKETLNDPSGRSTRRGARQTLEIIVSKLDTFVKVVDETAKVSNLDCMC